VLTTDLGHRYLSRTAREVEVLALTARHLTNAQIVDALFISTRTVEIHLLHPATDRP